MLARPLFLPNEPKEGKMLFLPPPFPVEDAFDSDRDRLPEGSSSSEEARAMFRVVACRLSDRAEAFDLARGRLAGFATSLNRQHLLWDKQYRNSPSWPRISQILKDVLTLGEILKLSIQQIRQFRPLPFLLLLNHHQPSLGFFFNLLADTSAGSRGDVQPSLTIVPCNSPPPSPSYANPSWC